MSKTYEALVEQLKEVETTVGSVGGGMVGEPPGPSKKKKKTQDIFAGDAVFEVSNEVFCACKGEKPRYERYAKHVGNDEVGEAIRQYGLKNPGKAIIIKDATYGTMMYLRGKKK